MNARIAASKITVITPCLNGVRYIGEAIKSVAEQCYPNVEHIVADGGSTDGTLALLSRYPHLKILTGPDSGVYGALNKALETAKGEIIGILNSDDCYSRDALLIASEYFEEEGIMALAGDAVSFRGASGAAGDEVARFTGAGEDLLYHATLGNPSMNAWFFRAAVFAQIGVFDASYQVAGDREFMLRLACSGLRCAQIPRLIYRYRIHPGSMTFGGNESIWETVVSEHNRMTADHLRRPTLSKRARTLITGARTRETLRMAFRSARNREWSKLMFYARAGIRYDAIWPLRFAKHALAALGARLFAVRLKDRHV
jgi:glycosyltransferase involved in cell wall biosynthesis